MRAVELIAAVILALVVFFALKLLGLFIKFALIAAVLGFVAGLLIARAFRGRSG